MSLPTDLNITLADVKAELLRRRRNKIDAMFPDDGPFKRDLYPKHMEVIAATAKFRQVCMMAANRVGKSELGAFIAACHLTGKYPAWYNGKRFDKPISAIVAGETASLVRDSMQEKLMGPITDIGTGLIPGDAILDKSPRSGVPNAFDTVRVQHVSGGVSSVIFKSYDQGREKFQATAQHFVLLDEEPPLDIYSELVLRTMTTGGTVLSTFTPLKGVSQTVLFLQKMAAENNAAVITATWSDCGHLSIEDQEELLRSLPPHQRDARSKGVPALGAGAVYPIPESEFVVTPIVIPKHWKWCFGMDVGWNNTAAVWLAYDPDADVAYLTHDYKRGEAEPSVHSAAIKARGEWIPGVIDPASRGRSQHDGSQLLQLYKNMGLNIRLADNAVESGLFEVYERLTQGRLKVFSTCTAFLEEFRLYRRDEKGRIVKEMDHIMDSLRYACVSGIPIAAANIPKTRTTVQRPISGGSWMAR